MEVAKANRWEAGREFHAHSRNNLKEEQTSMLTIRQNLLETIHGGHPDRFVNQYMAHRPPCSGCRGRNGPAPHPGRPTRQSGPSKIS